MPRHVLGESIKISGIGKTTAKMDCMGLTHAMCEMHCSIIREDILLIHYEECQELQTKENKEHLE